MYYWSIDQSLCDTLQDSSIIVMSKYLTITQRLKYSLAHQFRKFSHLGLYKYVSLVNFILLFKLTPLILQPIWPHLMHSFSPTQLYTLLVLTINLVGVIVYNLAMYIIYTHKMPFFEQFRSDPGRKWLWEQDRQKWKQLFSRTLTNLGFNMIVVGGVLSWTSCVNRLDIDFKLQTQPATWTMVWQFFVFLVVEQITFYLSHRLLHTPQLYWIHKQHHEYNTTISLALAYANPLEFIANSISIGLGYTLLSRVYPVHIFTVIIWLIFRVIQSSDGHCGYDWPWALSHWLPFSAGGNYHYFHHSNNSGNYAAILHICDTLANTNAQYLQLERKGEDKTGQGKSQ